MDYNGLRRLRDHLNRQLPPDEYVGVHVNTLTVCLPVSTPLRTVGLMHNDWTKGKKMIH